MARTKIDNTQSLKNFVEALQEKYPNAVSYDRATVEDIAKSNPRGLTMFASEKQGHGKLTRLSRGSYIIPKAWTNGEAPWDTVKEVVVEQKSPKSKKIAA